MLEWTGLRAPNALLVIAFVDLDSWDHAVLLDDRYHLLASGILLEERLPMQDHAADELVEARRREAQGPVGSAILNCVWDLCGIGVASTKPRPCGLVCCQKTLAWRAQLLGGLFQLCHACRVSGWIVECLLHKPDHGQLPVSLIIVCPLRVIAHSLDTTVVSKISDNIQCSHLLETLRAFFHEVRREQGLSMQPGETFVSLQHAI
mmetsp:Transcript_33156/g.64271  ORF Transcript_33156/g.64271 Transcript_33156/m.64271 type:complete len:205 (+) Transcript_33156:289-903(+)